MKTLLLQSSDSFDEMVEFNPISYKFTWWSKEKNPNKPSRPIQGHIGLVDNHILILYRSFDEILHLVLDRFDTVVTESIIVNLHLGRLNKLSVYQDGERVFVLEYKPKELIPPVEEDMTPFLDQEDFDFVLFLNNVIK